MRNLFISLFVVSLVAGCATTPSTPKPHETKYAIQVLEVLTPTPVFANPDLLEESLNNKDSKIDEYPCIYAEVGETVGDDQTEKVLMPESYDVIDGKAVPKEKLVRLGKAVEASISSIKNGNISYTLDIYNKQFKCYESYKISEGIEVKMPYFTFRGMNTKLTHQLNTWLNLGSLPDGKGNTHFFCVRILPPEGSK